FDIRLLSKPIIGPFYLLLLLMRRLNANQALFFRLVNSLLMPSGPTVFRMTRLAKSCQKELSSRFLESTCLFRSQVLATSPSFFALLFTTRKLEAPMPRTNREHKPCSFAQPCNSPARSAAECRVVCTAGTLPRDRCTQRLRSRLYRRRRLLFLAPSPARLCKAAELHRVPVALAFAACARESRPL